MTIGGVPARMAFAAPDRMAVVVPPGLDGGDTPVKVAWLPGATLYARVGTLLATGLHQVDNPVFGADGNLYVTYSGSRGQEATVSIFKVTANGAREPFVHGLVNPTSMALGPDGHLYVSSRFEGRVYRIFDDGRYEVMASDLGVACGLAFGADGSLFVGDRRGRCSASIAGPHRDLRERAVEHRGVSPRDVAGRRSVRLGADAGVVRFVAQDRSRGPRRNAEGALRAPAGSRV